VRAVAAEERGSGTTRLLFGMALASGITSIPNAAIVLALPTLHKQFDASLTELQWTVTGYLLAYSAFMIAAGRLADIFGRKKLLVIGTLIYMGASVAAALADSALALIISLIVMGTGAAVLTPGSLAIVTNGFRGSRRAMAVGVWGAASALFSGVAPALGGFFTDQMSWRWILWFNVIIGVGILIGVRGGEESRDETVPRKIDIAGLLLSVAGLAAIVLALNEAPTWELTSPKVILLIVGGLLLLAAFCVVERRIRDPLIDLAMFAHRNVSGASIVVFVLNFAFGAVLFFIPLYLQEFLHYDPLEAGFLLLPASATMMIGMPLGAWLFNKVGPLPPIVGGMALSAIGMLLLGRIDDSTTYSELWFPLGMEGLGLGVALTPMNLAALNAMPRRVHGAVGGILAMLSGLGATFGVAVSGAVNESLQHDRTVENAADAGITISNSTATSLDGLLAGNATATKTLDSFPADQRDALTNAVHEAFTSALGTTMLLSFGVTVAGIILALLLIRREEMATEEAPEDQDRPAAIPSPPEPILAGVPEPSVGLPYTGLSPKP
jgi:EmrB/QacA subfamily drug resistance transporter